MVANADRLANSGREPREIGSLRAQLAAALQALRDAETRLELATIAAGIGVWDWDVLTNEMIYSDRAKEIFGFPLNAPVTMAQVRAATHPEDWPRTAAMARRALDPQLRERVPYEYRIVRPDGAVRCVMAHGHAVFDTVDGAAKGVRYLGTIRDVTEGRVTQDALRDSEGRLRLAIDAGRMAVWEYDVATETLRGSPELNRVLGFPPDATPTRDELREGYPEHERERVQAAGIEALTRGDRYFEVEFRYLRRADTSPRWLMLRAEFELNAAGIPQRVIGVILDITDQRRALERQELLINELNHRVRNTMATIHSIAAQTLRHSPTLGQAEANLEARLMALSRAHDLLTEQGWEHAPIAAVVERALSPVAGYVGRIEARGAAVSLGSGPALDLAMVLQELITNAIKYGALSEGEAGRVSIEWSVWTDGPREILTLRWIERDGPPVAKSTRSGFGSRLIRALSAGGGGDASFDFAPSGLRCTVSMVLPPPAFSPLARPGTAPSAPAA